MHIRILAFDGADELDFIGPLEVFRRAARLVAGVDVGLVTLAPSEQVTAAYGLRVVPDGVLDDACDLLIVPGGGWASQSPLGIRTEIERGLLITTLARLHSQGTIIAGVCTGTMALAAAGLLDGRSATTHRAALPELRSTPAKVVEARVVDDGDIVTCGGVTSSLDLAHHLVQRFWGAQVSRQIADNMEFTPSPNVADRNNRHRD